MQSTIANKELMQQARESLRGKWGNAAGVFLLYGVIMAVISIIPVGGSIIQVLIAGPFTLGLTLYALRLSRGESVDVSTIFEGFNDFSRALVAFLLTSIYILLWTLLLIIPGIMAAFSYAMTYFILLDNPDLTANEAIDLSKQMMLGNRWKLFCLMFRFIGWMLVCVITLGIAAFWVSPYMQVSIAAFYADIKSEPLA